jgi:YVTN family beta-propeller protein
MRLWGLGAALILLTLCVGGCSSNSTPVAVTVTASGSSATSSSVTILVNNSVQFAASVTGGSASSVFWQICQPTTTPPSTTVAPTVCSQGQGPASCPIPIVSKPLTGFGTITSNGLYTAPSAPPQPDSFLVVATSCVKTTAFGFLTVVVDSGIRVQISPSTATIGTGETFQFTASVTGPGVLSSGVAWAVCQTAATSGAAATNCGLASLGTISSSGLYTAPGSAQNVIIQATSTADPTRLATATVAVSASGPPTVTGIDPSIAAQGSAQQDIFLTGANFFSTSTVVVGGAALPSANVVFLSTSSLRATIPAAQLAQAGPIPVIVQDQMGNSSTPVNLSLVAVRPAVVASSPDSVSQNSASANVVLTGGFFSTAATTATFNGQALPLTISSSRQLLSQIPAGSLGTPGLYPIVVQNAGVVAGQPSLSALNLAVTPAPALIPQSPVVPSIAVGTSPSAVAIDEAEGIAVVANTGSNSISLISLATDSVTATVAVGNQPTGVAVDDLLPDPVAVVVNNADQTVSAVDLVSKNVATLNVSIASGTSAPLPFAIGVNPVTHRAIVAYQSTNEAMVLDVSDVSGTPALSSVQVIGGNSSLYGTGAKPGVAIDPKLNWAVVTPGGAGTISLVDLGVHVSAGEPNGRAPQVVGDLSISTSVQGVGINSETHQALLTDPSGGQLTTFSLLDNTVTTVTLPAVPPATGATFSEPGFGAAAVSPLENVGIAVSGTPSGSSAVVVDMENGIVLQTVGGLGTSPSAQAVAVDPVSNQAVVVDNANGTVAILSLGPALNPLQITEASPAIAYGGPAAVNLTLTINGAGFIGGSSVLLDNTAVPITSVSANGRQIVATVPANMLALPRRYAIQVQNPANISNATSLTAIVPVSVGSAPVGVAVDTDRDLAYVTNSGDGTLSLVSLASPSPTLSPESLGVAGTVIGAPITVGTTPAGVGAISRLGLAIVSNHGSNDLSVVNVAAGVPVPAPIAVPLCAGCTAPAGVAINQDTATGAIADTEPGSSSTTGDVSLLTLPATTSSTTSTVSVDQDPVAVAIDPTLNYTGVVTASSTSSMQFIDMSTLGIAGSVRTGLDNPTGVVFDPVNQVFLTANSLANEIVIIDPATFIQTPSRVGIGPSSLDYNFQTSTIVTVNSVSHTMSVMAYVCPPVPSAPQCLGTQVRTVMGLGGTITSSPLLGPNSIAIDPKLNLGALVDEDNNRVLLVPLP